MFLRHECYGLVGNEERLEYRGGSWVLISTDALHGVKVRCIGICLYCGEELGVDLLRHEVAERMRNARMNSLTTGGFTSTLARCLYGDVEVGNPWLCADLMADLCALLDPDGDPEEGGDD